MKIGILTFTDGTNFGQRLQNYALQTSLQILGVNEVYTIRQTYSITSIKNSVKIMCKDMLRPKILVKKIERAKKFHGFNNKFIKFFPKRLWFYTKNNNISKQFDAFIVGSDQVWNYRSPFVGNNFFLLFANKEKRLTYAPSFAVSEIPDSKINYYQDRLNGFKDITVREYQGACIIKKLTGKDASVVLDPTLLLEKEDWDKIKFPSSFKPNDKYILAYFLGETPLKKIYEIQDAYKCQVLYLDSLSEIAPDEFIDLIDGASLVLTDSYHGVIFSIIYERPFINFERSGNGVTMNSRFESLYKLLGIHSKKVFFSNEYSFNVCYDFKNITKNLEKERKRSLKILKEEIDNIRD